MALSCARGDTLTISGVYTDPATGTAITLTGVAIRCEIVRGLAREVLTCTTTDEAAGEYTISAAASVTKSMAIGEWRGDVQFTYGATVISSQPFVLTISEDITGAAD